MMGFALSEGWRAFRNLGLTGLLTLTALTTTLGLLGVSLRTYLAVNDWSRGLLGKFELEAFLKPEADSSQGAELAAQIRQMPNVTAVRYISKADAARRFVDQFGSELFDLVEYNPLPPSLIVTLSRRTNPATGWEAVSAALRRLPGVDDVVYQGELLVQMRRTLLRMGEFAVAALAVTLAVSLGLTALTVMGAIRSRAEFLRVLALVGGTRAMAWSPFLVMGAIYGVCASALSVAGVEALAKLVAWGWSLEVPSPWWWLPALFAAGIIIGVTGAGWAASRTVNRV